MKSNLELSIVIPAFNAEKYINELIRLKSHGVSLAWVCTLDGIKFAFLTCYDAYFNEQIEFIAKHRPDIILVPGYQRGERVDIIRAQAKLTAFR